MADTRTFLDLFAGIGGFHLAFAQNGCGCVAAIEADKFARQTYEANFGMTPMGDVREIDAADLPDFDILAAGFPCQPFSIAGISRRNPLGRPSGFDDKERGMLFLEICRILEARRPKAFLLENVKNLVAYDHGNAFRTITGALEDLGYRVFWKVCDASPYVPQRRLRVLIAGFDGERWPDVDFSFNLEPPQRAPVLRDILEDDPPAYCALTDRAWEGMQRHRERHAFHKQSGFGYRIADPDGSAGTLTARYHKDGKEILVAREGANPRRLSVRECARLMGFPDSFVFPVSRSQAYKQCGNSVAVPLMADVARLIVEKLDDLERGHQS